MRRVHPVQAVASCLLAAFSFSSVAADVRLPAVVGDHMVLQHGWPVPIWGWADPGEKVTVKIADQSCLATADDSGKWSVTLASMPAGGPHQMTVQGNNAIKVNNVLVGEVWFCTGPSNIFWPVSRCDNAKEEIAAADYPRIRFFTVERNAADTPQADCVGHWFECSPKTVGDVSGVGYFFGRRLHTDLDMPVGILQSFWGGSRVEAWTSIEALKAQPELKPILDYWESSVAQFDSGKAQAEYQGQLKRWQQAAAEAKAEGKKPPSKPKPPEDPRLSRHRPGCLYNGMVAPLIPYGIRGVLSYQGLGNLFFAEYSLPLLRAMIGDWRSRWHEGPVPFGMVQPAPFCCDSWPKSRPDAYALQREAQLLLLGTVPNVGVAPTMDQGGVNVLHFPNKQEVGRRMALWLATVYGRDVAYSGPVYKSMAVEGNKIRVSFTHTGTGLATRDGRAPSDFTIAGSDNLFHQATATIDGHTVLVQSDRVPKPLAVRFAFSETAVANLINKEGLPASLFRTDAPASADTPQR